jgi:hypothetical protein
MAKELQLDLRHAKEIRFSEGDQTGSRAHQRSLAALTLM